MTATDSEPTSKPIRVLIVDDDALVRAGLAMILGAATDMEVVGEHSDGEGLQAVVHRTRPDVVLMDIRMPAVDGLTATRQLTSHPDHPKVLVLTTFHLDDYVLGALRAGASGFLLKDTAPQQIIDGVRVVARGQAILSPEDTHKLITHYASQDASTTTTQAPQRLASLSDREREIAVLVARGHSNSQIAAQVFVSEATVKAHVSHILTKLDAENRVQIALAVYEAGLL